MADDKVFGIGLNKTGTSSLHAALETLGYRVCGPHRALLRAIRQGDLGAIDAVVRDYDAFEDLPWPLVVEHLVDRYGNEARFVLTLRASPEKWFGSIENHARMSGPLTDTWRLAYGFARPFGREREFIEAYRAHTERVRALFRERGMEKRLLELCFERGDGWPELCGFLGRPEPADMPFPHRNAADPKRKRLNRALNAVLVEPAYRAYAALG